MWLTARLLDVLPVGSAYFPDTPIHGLTYGELGATLVIILSLAFFVGVLHGFLYGQRYVRLIACAALSPLLVMMLGLAAVTMGMGMIALPVVVAYGMTVARGMHIGADIRDTGSWKR